MSCGNNLVERPPTPLIIEGRQQWFALEINIYTLWYN